MSKIRKTRSARFVAWRIILFKCKQDKSVKPVKLMFGKYRYGSRNQFTGSLVDYVEHCRRLKIGVNV